MELAPLFEKYRESLPRISSSELALYEHHYSLLREWNEKINLVSRKSVENAFAIHYADCIQICHLSHPFIQERSVCDLGSGGGFPGILFAIRYPEIPIKIFEKLQKKRAFLEVVLKELKLDNAELHGAMEKQKDKTFLLARAVFPRDELFPFLKRFLPKGSRFIHNVGGSVEVPPPPKPFQLKTTLSYELPSQSGPRRIDVIDF